ncbi:MAG: cytochrome ubiquinol oxidase subunit I, partial [Anaerolineales bacterium]
MDPVILSRWQFAITTIFHFFFVPVTLGLALFVAILETKYVTSGDELYKKMVKFWSK